MKSFQSFQARLQKKPCESHSDHSMALPGVRESPLEMQMSNFEVKCQLVEPGVKYLSIDKINAID